MIRGEVWSISLNPVKGSEQKGMRPAVIISPDSMNSALSTRVVVPLTTKSKPWPSRVKTNFNNLNGEAMCEQIRTVSVDRFSKKIGNISDVELVEILSTLSALYGTV